MRSAWRTWREDVVGVGVIAAMATGAWLVVVRPSADAQTEAARLQTQTDLLRSQVAMVQTQARVAQADLDLIRERLDAGTPLQPRSEFNRVLASLNASASECGITLQRSMPGAVESLPEILRQRITLSGRGTFGGAVEFLRTIRDRFPDVSVTVVSAQSDPMATDGAVLLSFEVAWHAQAERAASRGAK